MATRTGPVGATLCGRRNECAALVRLVHDVRSGQSSALVLRGEPGCGKTALLSYLLDEAADFRVARVLGVESEMELAFAGVHQLCAQILDRLDELPDPQRDALRVAFGLRPGPAPDRFLVGLAVLSLLALAAEDRPLLCVIDDAQWLDKSSLQAMAFVSRRLVAESIAVVFATTKEAEPELVGLPGLAVDRLSDADARVLLASAVHGLLDDQIRDRIVAETDGNPLALLELPRGMSAAELAGGFSLPDARPLTSRIEQSFQRRIESLPADTRLLLLTAAAEPVGDPMLLWLAAEQLGFTAAAAAPAERASLLEVGTRVRFRHPLVRSAVYHSATPDERHRVHLALAEVTAPADSDRRAWHRAQAAPGPDEEVAEELERSAGRAQARGGFAAAAAFLARSAGLTMDPARRIERALAAAHAKYLAGAPGAALELLRTAQVGPLTELQMAQVDLLHGQIAFAVSRGSDAPPLLLKAANLLDPLDPTLARATYLEALSAAVFAGRLASGAGVFETAEAARSAPPAQQPPRPSDLLLDGLVAYITEGPAAGAPTLHRALEAFRREDLPTDIGLRWLWLACHTALVLWDYDSWQALAARHVSLTRDTGAFTVLPLALSSQIGVHIFGGELDAAVALVDEVRAVTETTGSNIALYDELGVAGWSGQAAETAKLIETCIPEFHRRGEGMGLTIAYWVDAVLHNGLGRYEVARVAAEQASSRPEQLGLAGWGLVELVEAAARLGLRVRAEDALERLVQTTRPAATPWALGVEARCRALLGGPDAEAFYLEALDHLSGTGVRVEQARTRLVYGEWLRRENRRVDAREQLRSAHEAFVRMGTEAFADRARRELSATGETVRKRSVESVQKLTAQEAQIARLARDGLTNSEIGAQLFISPRTVEWHMGKVFTKLDIRSRWELREAPDL